MNPHQHPDPKPDAICPENNHPPDPETDTSTSRRRVMSAIGIGAAATGLAAALSSRAGGGPLDPPAGLVAPTMLSLDEIEPSTPINAANTPGNTAAHFVIRERGRYHLTGDINTSDGRDGVIVDAEDVMIDGRGLLIHGNQSANGITFEPSARRCLLARTRFDACRSAVNAEEAEDLTVEDCRASRTLNEAIFCADRATIRHCSVGESSNVGIQAGADAAIEWCLVRQAGDHGISCGGRSRVQHCTVLDAASAGIRGGSGSTVRGCAVTQVGAVGVFLFGDYGAVEHCRVLQCTLSGIQTGANTTVSDSSISGCGGYGVYVEADSSIIRCTVHRCATSTVPLAFAGLRIREGCRAESCILTENTNGVLVFGGSRGWLIRDCTIFQPGPAIYLEEDALSPANLVADNRFGTANTDLADGGIPVLFPFGGPGGTLSALGDGIGNGIFRIARDTDPVDLIAPLSNTLTDLRNA